MKRKVSLLLSCVLLVPLIAGCVKENPVSDEKLDAKNPVTITVWHYYNGGQLEAFDSLVAEFNDTVGKEKGVIVESSGQGNVSDLENNVLDAANRKVGAAEVPNIFAAYADTAYAVDQLDLVVNLSDYLSKEEKGRFIESYLIEGQFPKEDDIKIYPIAKSTEICMLNKTDWDKFASATGASVEELRTVEGVTAIAEQYYNWTDSLTENQNDGRSFFGRDAMANYYIVGSRQLGAEVVTVEDAKPVLNLDKSIAKKLWDNYYIPHIKGYFGSTGRFRSDDIKTGNLICSVASSAGATFFPKEVILNDTQSYPIEMMALPAPIFEGGEKVAVQQGAGMVVTRTEETKEKEVQGSLEFLKWFTQDDRNIQFSVSSGYLPVAKSANSIDKVKASVGGNAQVTGDVLEVSLETVKNNQMYTSKAFKSGTEVRKVLEYSMKDLAKADRENVRDNLAKGMTLEEAIAPFATEAYFDTWYTQTEKTIKELMQ